MWFKGRHMAGKTYTPSLIQNVTTINSTVMDDVNPLCKLRICLYTSYYYYYYYYFFFPWTDAFKLIIFASPRCAWDRDIKRSLGQPCSYLIAKRNLDSLVWLGYRVSMQWTQKATRRVSRMLSKTVYRDPLSDIVCYLRFPRMMTSGHLE